MNEQGIIGIEGVDTRAQMRRIRLAGVIKGVTSTGGLDPTSLIKKTKASQGLGDMDLAKEVTFLINLQALWKWKGIHGFDPDH